MPGKIFQVDIDKAEIRDLVNAAYGNIEHHLRNAGVSLDMVTAGENPNGEFEVTFTVATDKGLVESTLAIAVLKDVSVFDIISIVWDFVSARLRTLGIVIDVFDGPLDMDNHFLLQYEIIAPTAHTISTMKIEFSDDAIVELLD